MPHRTQHRVQRPLPPSPLDLPENRSRSPYTGWDRRHWEAQADRLLAAVVPYATPGRAGYALPGRTSWSGEASDALEGYARTFLLAAFRIAGAEGKGEAATELLERYAAGLSAGTDARTEARTDAHPAQEAWPRIDRDRVQPMVEAASIALALHETRSWLWDALPAATQERTAEWLGGFVGRTPVGNNWVLFQTVVEEFLCSVGADHADAEIRRGLDALDGWYLGDGWYTDGPGRRIDHYNGWALHLYPLLWTRIAAGGPRAELAAELGVRFRERLRRFLDDYVHLVGGDGAPLHQGRSLTYRFAAAAPLWMGELFDCAPGPTGTVRRAASGMLRHFAEHGAPDPSGVLTLGWHDEFLGLTQPYSGPASPYWAAKGFLGLLLPADHPAWTATEQPLPVDTSDGVRLLRGPNWLVQATHADGVVRVHNHGSDGLDPAAGERSAPSERTSDPHYAKLAYTTCTGPVLPAAADNELTLSAPNGATPTDSSPTDSSPTGPTALPRGPVTALDAPDLPGLPGLRLAGSVHTVDPAAGTRVESWTLADGRFELRLHAVVAPAGWRISAGGHALAAKTPPLARQGRHWTVVEQPETGTARRLRSALAPLHGFDPSPDSPDKPDRPGSPGSRSCTTVRATEANAFGPHAAFPLATTIQPDTGVHVLATCVVLSAEPLDADAPPPFTISGTLADGLRIRTPSGHTLLAEATDRADATPDSTLIRLRPAQD
ncbi:DUF2264 domain-containing protein [Streptacidiphilus fuscans]|uniref:DUF2264 domain-containing protein n=1 Tax=Streptacidiphilus fuscans TaxID=2789292 RepID=A0A931FH86_9ACTN|nr:DUF2264 domain-containing protein [Streptacidiphilus fuscans]MBF9072110.1 DUF2264 domain-containing protein [Streptacidiphilus fuscans]